MEFPIFSVFGGAMCGLVGGGGWSVDCECMPYPRNGCKTRRPWVVRTGGSGKVVGFEGK